MGSQKGQPTKKFTLDDVKNKQLVIKMLSSEHEYGTSDVVKNMYENKIVYPIHDLTITYAVHRHILNKFGFDTSDESVQNYRKIFKHYYNSPYDYDKDVISSVYYMKYNKCIFYKEPVINVGDSIINCNLLDINGNKTSLFSILDKNTFTNAFIGAFSNS